MSNDLRAFVPSGSDLVALGEPAHAEPALRWIRNDLIEHLADRGFRSIALETDRVAALAVNDYVQQGAGSLDAVMKEGFSHGFGDLAANRELVAWMREHNQTCPAADRLTFHGFDGQMENTSAPSPLRYLEHARDYLALDLDLAALAGADDRWSRSEAILDPAASVGDTAEADQLRALADDMLGTLYARAPELIASTSRNAWFRAKTHLTAGLGLLRYHRQAARRTDEGARISGLLATRDAIMAQNLLDIRDLAAGRGPTLVFAHNAHLRRDRSAMPMAGLHLEWYGAGAIVAALVGQRYTFVAGSLGRSAAVGLGEPAPDTYEGLLQAQTSGWGVSTASSVASGRTRTEKVSPQQGYGRLDKQLLAGADAILHVTEGGRPVR